MLHLLFWFNIKPSSTLLLKYQTTETCLALPGKSESFLFKYAHKSVWCYSFFTLSSLSSASYHAQFGRWKIHEATMLGVGSLSKMLMEHVAGNKLALDINTFLQNVVLVDLNQNGE